MMAKLLQRRATQRVTNQTYAMYAWRAAATH